MKSTAAASPACSSARAGYPALHGRAAELPALEHHERIAAAHGAAVQAAMTWQVEPIRPGGLQYHLQRSTHRERRNGRLRGGRQAGPKIDGA
jgi:hypothetical protein